MSTNVDNVNVSEISAMSMLKTRYRFNIADVANIDDVIIKKIYVGPISYDSTCMSILYQFCIHCDVDDIEICIGHKYIFTYT